MATPSSSARDAIVAMAAKYSEGLPGYVDASTLPRYIAPASHSPPKYPVTVLLTGSTGHLGSEILASLLTDERIERVYTLDRAGKENSLDRARKGASLDRAGRGVSDGVTAGVRDRQRARWADKGLDDELLQSPKLVPLEGDVSAPRFGQSDEVYREMFASVSVIIHTAWRVNFNHPLDEFESSVKGVRALVDFVREASGAGCARQASQANHARKAEQAGYTRQAEPVDGARQAEVDEGPHARSVRFLFTSSTTAARSWEDVADMGSGDAEMQFGHANVNAAHFAADVEWADSAADSQSAASTARSSSFARDMPPSCHPIPSVVRPRASSLTLPRSLSSTIPRAPSPTLPHVPELLISDLASCIGGGGYGQSKYVAERILAASGIEFASVRIGQVCGGRGRVRNAGRTQTGAEICINETRRGAWATTNWFPILVKTSLALGALPTDEQPMPWLPMDVTAHALLDIVFSSKPLEPSYNLVHPRPILFSRIMGFVQRSLASTLGQLDLSLVPFKEWMARLEDAARRPGVSARDVPGIKLIPFLHDVCAGGAFGREFAMKKMMTISPALRDLDPICQADVDAWVRYWEECGMFSGRGTDVMRARM
ncbi:male sterility protein-domain-containing protein [Schizophyllum commune]